MSFFPSSNKAASSLDKDVDSALTKKIFYFNITVAITCIAMATLTLASLYPQNSIQLVDVKIFAAFSMLPIIMGVAAIDISTKKEPIKARHKNEK